LDLDVFSVTESRSPAVRCGWTTGVQFPAGTMMWSLLHRVQTSAVNEQ